MDGGIPSQSLLLADYTLMDGASMVNWDMGTLRIDHLIPHKVEALADSITKQVSFFSSHLLVRVNGSFMTTLVFAIKIVLSSFVPHKLKAWILHVFS